MIKPKDRLTHYDYAHTLGNNCFLPRKNLLPAYGAKTTSLEGKKMEEEMVMKIPNNSLLFVKKRLL